MQKLDRMIEDNSILDQSKEDLLKAAENDITLADKTVVVKEENVLISGNPKQGLKLKIHNSGLKYTIDPKNNAKDQDKINEIPIEERNHRIKMNEFYMHLEKRSIIINKIKELKERK